MNDSTSTVQAKMEREGEQRARECYLAALSDLLSGGLLVDTKNGYDLPPERALMLATGAMLKAVTLSMFAAGQDDERRWCMSSPELTPDEAHLALSGIVAILSNAPQVIETLRSRGEFRESHERGERASSATNGSAES